MKWAELGYDPFMGKSLEQIMLIEKELAMVVHTLEIQKEKKKMNGDCACSL